MIQVEFARATALPLVLSLSRPESNREQTRGTEESYLLSREKGLEALRGALEGRVRTPVAC